MKSESLREQRREKTKRSERKPLITERVEEITQNDDRGLWEVSPRGRGHLLSLQDPAETDPHPGVKNAP